MVVSRVDEKLKNKKKSKKEKKEKKEKKDQFSGEEFERNLTAFYDKMKLKDLMLLRNNGERASLSSVIEFAFFHH